MTQSKDTFDEKVTPTCEACNIEIDKDDGYMQIDGNAETPDRYWCQPCADKMEDEGTDAQERMMGREK